MPFIRVFKYKTVGDYIKHLKGEAPPLKRFIDKELLVNTDHITKIEVEYAMPGEGNADDSHVDIEDGLKTGDAIKWYKVFIGSEEVTLRSDPDDPVVKVIEDIYNKAIKGRGN
jgi:hypothetical protein